MNKLKELLKYILLGGFFLSSVYLFLEIIYKSMGPSIGYYFITFRIDIILAIAGEYLYAIAYFFTPFIFMPLRLLNERTAYFLIQKISADYLYYFVSMVIYGGIWGIIWYFLRGTMLWKFLFKGIIIGYFLFILFFSTLHILFQFLPDDITNCNASPLGCGLFIGFSYWIFLPIFLVGGLICGYIYGRKKFKTISST